MTSIEVVNSQIEIILKAIKTLKKEAPQWTWKNYIGDFGEFYCIHHSKWKKAPTNTTAYDAITENGQTVSIKARTNLKGQVELTPKEDADLLVVFFVDENASVEQIYYGCYSAAKKIGKPNKKNEIVITLTKLQKLAESEPQLTDPQFGSKSQ